MKALLLILWFSMLCLFIDAQNSVVDSTQRPAKNKATYSAARKASLLSAVLPGAGQIYNRSYWKVPVIYAGLGGFGYVFFANNTDYYNCRKALRLADNSSGSAEFKGEIYSTDQLLTIKKQYDRQRNIGAIGIFAFYFLNIIDANVDAHLRSFDVSDDLSLRWRPDVNYIRGNYTAGICLQLNFK